MRSSLGHVKLETISRVIEHVDTVDETHLTKTCDMGKLAVIGN